MRYSIATTASPPDVLRLARETFGPAGHGLRLTTQDLSSVRLEAAAGFVALEATRDPAGQTVVVVETREFDAEARRFLASLPHWTLWARIKAAMRR